MPVQSAQPDAPSKPGRSWRDAAKPHIPNALTIARLILAGIFVWLLSGIRVRPMPPDSGPIDWLGVAADPATARLIAASGLFVVAALTDALDGMLARKWSVISKFGRVMDPLADKVLVLGAFVILAGPAFAATTADARPVQLSGVLPWMAVVILARELLVTSIRAVFEAQGVDFSAGISGKAKMILQSIAVPVLLLIVAAAAPLPGSPARPWVVAIAWATVVVTAVSGIPYIIRAIQMNGQTTADAADERVPERIQRIEPAPKPAPRPRTKAKKRPAKPSVEKIEIPATHTRSRASKARSKPPRRPSPDKENPTP